MDNEQLSHNNYYLNNNFVKVNNFINNELKWLSDKTKTHIENFNIYDKIIYVINNRKLEWCYQFSQYCFINKLCDTMKHQFEYLIYYCDKDTIDYVISIIMEVYYCIININDANKIKKYSETLNHLVYTDTPCNYNLEYPIRLYNIIDLLPFREE